ncbi:MAG: rubredoxin [Candidatus Freyarchaeota archaeon]
MEKWQCTSCGYIYDHEVGDPDGGIPCSRAPIKSRSLF